MGLGLRLFETDTIHGDVALVDFHGHVCYLSQFKISDLKLNRLLAGFETLFTHLDSIRVTDIQSQQMAPPPLVHGKFECVGDGLTVSGHKRASQTGLEFALGIQKLGRILPNGREKIIVEKYPKTWWEAQVRLYGLKCTKWTIDGMKKVLFEAVKDGIEPSAEIKALEERLNKEYTESEKENSKSDDNVSDQMKRTMEILGLTTMAANTTAEERALMAKAFTFCVAKTTEASKAQQLAKMNREHEKLLKSADGPGTDVFGTWQFDCPGIPEQWGQNASRNIIWKIHPPLVHDAHLWCSFKQITVEGVMRIDWKSALERNNWRNRKNNFTFRGISCGDGDFMCDDEWNKGWIKFTSEHECHGMFETQYSDEPWPFTGKKIGLKATGKRSYTLAQEYKKLGRDWTKQMTCF